MNTESYHDQSYKGLESLEKADYENCQFTSCTFKEQDLSGYTFTECEFEACDLSMAKVIDTAFRDVQFVDCKILGLRLESCNSFLLSFEFTDCVLNFSSFYGLNLKETRFNNCKLHDVDFVESNLKGSVFDSCDLKGAMFENTTLEKADLRTSQGFSINPEINTLRQAKFSKENALGLLGKYNIDIQA